MRKIKKKVAAGATIAAIATTGGLSAAIVACSPNKPEEKKPEERKETTPQDTTPQQQGSTKQLDESQKSDAEQNKQTESNPEQQLDSGSQESKKENSKKEEEPKKESPLIPLQPAVELATYYIPSSNEKAQINLNDFTSDVDFVLNWGTQELGNEDQWTIQAELQQKDNKKIIESKPTTFTKEKNKNNEQTIKLTFGTMEDKVEYTVKSVKIKSVSTKKEIDVQQNKKYNNTIQFEFKDQENKQVKNEDKETDQKRGKHVITVSYKGENPLNLKSGQEANIEVEYKLDGSGTTHLDRNLALLGIGYQTQDGLKQVPISKVIDIKNGKATIKLNKEHVKLLMDQQLSHIWIVVSSVYSWDFSLLAKYRLNYESNEFISDYKRDVPLVYIKVPVLITKN